MSGNRLLEASLAKVRRIVLDGLGPVPAKVYLFGSRADGTARESSDIDVGVLALAPLPPGTLARIREELEESLVPWRVDLVDLNTAPAELCSNVERTGIPWNV